MKKTKSPELKAHNQKPDQLNQRHDFPPLKDKSEVMDYLLEGEPGGRGYKEGNIPIVLVTKLRTLLLEAGFTEMALASIYFGYHTDLRESKKYPQAENERLTVTFNVQHPYVIDQLRVGATYDAVQLLRFLLPQINPDMPAEKDELRAYVLAQISEMKEVRKQLESQGKRPHALSQWSFTRQGEVIFWINTLWNQKEYAPGWYTLDELKTLLTDDPESPILRKNRKPRSKNYTAAVKENGVWIPRNKVDLRSWMYKYSRKPHKDLRMLRILLLGCPFPDLVARYSKKLK